MSDQAGEREARKEGKGAQAQGLKGWEPGKKRGHCRSRAAVWESESADVSLQLPPAWGHLFLPRGSPKSPKVKSTTPRSSKAPAGAAGRLSRPALHLSRLGHLIVSRSVHSHPASRSCSLWIFVHGPNITLDQPCQCARQPLPSTVVRSSHMQTGIQDSLELPG